MLIQKTILISKINVRNARTRTSTTIQTLPWKIMSTMRHNPNHNVRDYYNLIRIISTILIVASRWNARTRTSTTIQTLPWKIMSAIVRISCKWIINQTVTRNSKLMGDQHTVSTTLVAKNRILFLMRNQKELVYTKKNVEISDSFNVKNHFYTLG